MRIPDPIANTTTEAYLAYKAGVLSEGELKPKLYDPYIHLDAWLAYWAGLTTTYPVKGVGKNLFNKNSVSTGYLNAYGTLNSDVAYKTSDFIAVKPNTAYSKTYTASPRTKYFDSTRQPLDTTTYQDIPIGGSAGTFTTPANAAYVRFSFPVAGVNIDTTQLELGSAVTAYEPYTGEPEMLTDEEALIAYLSGVTNTYPEEFRDPADVRVAAYLKYLVSARWGRPEYPVTNEELYLSMMDAPYIPAGEPSSDIEIDDTAEAPFKDVKMYGDTSQQTYTGKNLLKMLIVSGSSNGITWTVQDDGSIILNGTSTAGVSIRANNVTIPAVEGETYTLSATGMGEAYNFGYKNASSGSDIFVVTSTSPTTTAVVTSTMLSQANRLDMYIQSGKTFNNQRVTLQLEKSATATPYEPYVGGIASPNPDYPQAVQTVTGENTVKICGKNLLDPSILEVGNITAQGVDSASTQVVRSNYIYLKAGNYALRVNDANNQIRIFRYVVYDTSKTFVSSSSPIAKQATIAMSADGYLRLCFYNAPWRDITVDEIVASNIQLEKGSSSSSFEPYQEQSYPISLGSIELCKIGTYQDYIYKSGGKWYVRKEVGKVALTSSGDWRMMNMSYSVGYTYWSLQDIITAPASVGSTDIRCAYFKAVQARQNWDTAVGDSSFNLVQSTKVLRFSKGEANGTGNLDSWKAWVDSVGLTVYYPLATPTDTEITNTALIDQLNALKNGGSYNGTTNIRLSATDPNLPGLLKVEAYKYD